MATQHSKINTSGQMRYEDRASGAHFMGSSCVDIRPALRRHILACHVLLGEGRRLYSLS